MLKTGSKNKAININFRFIVVDIESNEVVRTEKDINRLVLVTSEELTEILKNPQAINSIITDEVESHIDFSAYGKVVNVGKFKTLLHVGTVHVNIDVILYQDTDTRMSKINPIKRFNFASCEG